MTLFPKLEMSGKWELSLDCLRGVESRVYSLELEGYLCEGTAATGTASEVSASASVLVISVKAKRESLNWEE